MAGEAALALTLRGGVSLLASAGKAPPAVSSWLSVSLRLLRGIGIV